MSGLPHIPREEIDGFEAGFPCKTDNFRESTTTSPALKRRCISTLCVAEQLEYP
jgi:hypothetical protein